MAEIPIEQKSGTKWWPWIIVALVVLGLLWFFAELPVHSAAQVAS